MVETRESRVESARSCRQKFHADGFAFVRALLSVSDVDHLRKALTPLLKTGRAGVRNLLRESSAVAELSLSEGVLSIVGELAGTTPFPVRGLLFDKTPRVNWRVAWHQDLTVAVNMRAEVAGFGPWSIKKGVVHAQAPVSVLERMLTVRIHLDDADETNGALQVIPGSHRFGKLDDAAIDRATVAGSTTICAVRAGDVLIMRPLLLHASSPAPVPNHRRVIDIEYATELLPAPLEWFKWA